MARVLRNGMMTGAVGDLVYRNCNGMQVVAARPVSNKVSRTDLQLCQRLKQLNVVQFYKWGKNCGAFKNNFEGKIGKQSDYTKFVSHNICKADSVYFTKMEAEEKACVAADYIASIGHLDPIRIQMSQGGLCTSICIGNLEINDSTRVSDLSKAIGRNNKDWQEGDELQLISYVQRIDQNTNVPFVKATCQRFVLDYANDRCVHDFALANVDGCIGYPNPLPQGSFVWVHHRVTERTHYVSSQTFFVNNDLLADYTSDAAKQRALESWK